MWTCRPSTSRRERERLELGRGSPNFEPAWPVRIDSCVSASIPGVTRTSMRPTPAAARSLELLDASRGRRARLRFRGRASSSSDLLLPCTTSRSPSMPGPLREAQLAERRDVRADPLLREQPQDRHVRERLRAVDDERVGRGRAVRARARPDRLLAVDDERRPELVRERGRADAAERQLAVVDVSGVGEELERGRVNPATSRCVLLPSPGPVFGAPIAISSAPSGPASSARIVVGSDPHGRPRRQLDDVVVELIRSRRGRDSSCR